MQKYQKFNANVIGSIVADQEGDLGTIVDIKFDRKVPYPCTEVQVKWSITGITSWIDVKKVSMT